MKRFTPFLIVLLLSLLVVQPIGIVDAKPAAATTSYKVSGQARIFEATYQYRIKVGKKVIKEGFGTAKQGAPEWGDFSKKFSIPNQYKKTATLELFWVSPEDNKRKDVIIIPLSQSKGKVYKNKSFRNVKVTVVS